MSTIGRLHLDAQGKMTARSALSVPRKEPALQPKMGKAGLPRLTSHALEGVARARRRPPQRRLERDLKGSPLATGRDTTQAVPVITDMNVSPPCYDNG